MIEKHRRRKQPRRHPHFVWADPVRVSALWRRNTRRHPHFVWADPERFYIERMSAGLTQVQAAEYLGVSIRTMRNWETGCNRIPVPAFKLIRMRARAIVHVPGWDGWRFGRDGALVTPDGRSFQPWELHNLQLVVSLARRYMESRKLAPLPVVAENVSMLRVVA